MYLDSNYVIICATITSVLSITIIHPRYPTLSIHPILNTMLKESDMISIHLPVVDSTKGIVNKDWFSKMKPTAIIVNTARAAVIDQKDFVEALETGIIGGAAIDVYWKEPVPSNHPLLSMRNVVCTPHMAGLTTDVDHWSGEMMSQEVLAYLKDEDRKYIWKR